MFFTRKGPLGILTLAALLVLPLLAQSFGNAWVRIIDVSLLYMLLALGLNIVVGFAGLLDLGYVAFYAVGAYMFALLASSQLTDNFPFLAAIFPDGLHTPFWIVLPLGALLAGGTGMLLGAPTLKLRGDYLAIVTLGFGEIVRVFMNNLDAPINITNGPMGIASIDDISLFGFSLGKTHEIFGVAVPKVTNYCYFPPRHRRPGDPCLLAARTQPHRPRLDGHPRGRGRRQGDGHQHPQHEAAGLWHGSDLRRRVRRDVRELPGLCLARILQPAGIHHDRRDDRARRARSSSRRHRRGADALARSRRCCATWRVRCSR